jgi:pimeloyl-ACP methyl ester carboxylesterase
MGPIAMTDTVRSKDGTTIAFDRSGDGPPLILVGGATGSRVHSADLAAQLAPRFTTLAYDRRGRGESGDTQPYAIEREIEDLEALIAASRGSAFVFGHSSGAVLALRAAASGLDIPRLALHEPPFIVDDSRPPVLGDFGEHLDELLAAGKRDAAVAYFMTDSVGMPAEVVAGMRQSPAWPRMVALAPTLAYDTRIMADTTRGDPAPLGQWAFVTTPTLIIDGTATFPFMHASADALAAVLPDAERATLEGQDHGPAPEVLAPVLIEFFGR